MYARIFIDLRISPNRAGGIIMVDLNYRFTEILDGLWSTAFEIITIPKKKNILKIKAKVILPNHDIETYPALLHENLKYCYIPQLGRVFFNEGLYRENGKRYAYVSYSYHKTLDLLKMRSPMLYKAVTKLKYMRYWKELKVEKIEGTLNLNLLDNALSIDLTSDIHSVLKTKAFEFMENIARRTYILTLIISFLVGGVIGAITIYIMLLLLG